MDVNGVLRTICEPDKKFLEAGEYYYVMRIIKRE
jgi:hypothetical protein